MDEAIKPRKAMSHYYVDSQAMPGKRICIHCIAEYGPGERAPAGDCPNDLEYKVIEIPKDADPIEIAGAGHNDACYVLELHPSVSSKTVEAVIARLIALGARYVATSSNVRDRDMAARMLDDFDKELDELDESEDESPDYDHETYTLGLIVKLVEPFKSFVKRRRMLKYLMERLVYGPPPIDTDFPDSPQESAYENEEHDNDDE